VFENFPYRLSYQDVDKQLGEIMTSYWVNFARTGDPNGAGLTRWPIYDPMKDDVIEFGDQVGVQLRVNAVGLDFFDEYNRARRPTSPAAAH
jgi:para-nitrobenzyl esterase